MSCKERDLEIEAGLEQVAKRRKTLNTSSLVCGDADQNDSKSKEDSCFDNDKESMCESDLKGDSKFVHPDEDSCVLEHVRRDIIPSASKSDQVICGSGGIIDTSRDTVVTMKSVIEILETMKSVSGILGKDDQVDGDDVSRDIGSSSADQSSCIVSEQMHLESPSINNLSNQISEQKQDTIMKDDDDAQTNLVETNEDDKEKKPQISMGIDVRRKLLVLDINGLLVDVVSISYVPDDYKADIVIGMKAVFKRPHCDDFLQFCFERFNVGIWSSRTKRNVDSILELLMGEHRSKLVFCWDQSHCTRTGFNTIDNRNKPLVLKELNKLWEKDDPSLPWNIGDYNESNTLLLDDSPYKGLKNPPNTAIFPDTYQYKNLKDDSLGPKGDLRSYLEELSLAPNVQKYVELNSHGQRPITESNPLWHFYAKVKSGDMAPRIPRGFGATKKKDDKAGPSEDKARHAHKKDKKTPTPTESLKRNLEVPQEPFPASSKKPRTEGAPSYVETLIGPAAATYIGENEVHSWQSMNAENEIHSMIQASSQLIIQSLGRAQRIYKEKLYTNKLEVDNKRLAEMVVENDNKWKKKCDSKDADNSMLKQELEEASKNLKHLVDKIDQLEKEKEELNVQLDSLEIEKADCWGDEKQHIEDLNFQKGFDFYLLGFIANDPDYNWEKFGPGCADDVAEFKVKNVAAIKAKRIELGLEAASEDAPSTENVPLNPDPDQSSHVEGHDAQSSQHTANPYQHSLHELITPLTTI